MEDELKIKAVYLSPSICALDWIDSWNFLFI